MNISRDTHKDTKQVEFEISQLLKRKDSNSEAFRSNNSEYHEYINENRINMHSLFDQCIRENKILGENFILLWLNPVDKPRNFFERAKNNLWVYQKEENCTLTEEHLVEELLSQYRYEITER